MPTSPIVIRPLMVDEELQAEIEELQTYLEMFNTHLITNSGEIVEADGSVAYVAELRRTENSKPQVFLVRTDEEEILFSPFEKDTDLRTIAREAEVFIYITQADLREIFCSSLTRILQTKYDLLEELS